MCLVPPRSLIIDQSDRGRAGYRQIRLNVAFSLVSSRLWDLLSKFIVNAVWKQVFGNTLSLSMQSWARLLKKKQTKKPTQKTKTGL